MSAFTSSSISQAQGNASSTGILTAESSTTSETFWSKAARVLGIVLPAIVFSKFVYNSVTGVANSPDGISRSAQKRLDATLERMKKAKVIAILRLKNYDRALERVQELVDMGYDALEVTTDSVGYHDGLLEKVQSLVGDRCLIGVGTITTIEQLEIAKRGGAAFALSPVNPKFDGFEKSNFTHECHVRGILAMPAAYTPQEVYTCQAEGAKTIKLFPAQKWTPAQLKALKGVGDFKDANICPSGGVNHENAGLWLQAGAMAVGMGSCLAGRDIKIADSESPEYQAAVERWETSERQAAAGLAKSLGLGR